MGCKPPARQRGRRGAGDSSPWQPFPWQPLAASGTTSLPGSDPTKLRPPNLSPTQVPLTRMLARAGWELSGGRAAFRTVGYGEHLPKFASIDFKPKSFQNPVRGGGANPVTQNSYCQLHFALEAASLWP